MQNNELETIAAAMQEALHRAYALGRSDALRRVVEMVQSDDLGSRTVALLSHSEPAVVEVSQTESKAIVPPSDALEDGVAHKNGAAYVEAAHEGAHNDNAGLDTAAAEQAKPPASVKHFLLDYLYPLGAKK